ncbi:MAG TPA: glycosyltransferase family 4 protein [Gemmatimonadaceae bacterium]|nr:glycosyltransferase family 4 protein [Gemmatimonadaceae bacterium]
MQTPAITPADSVFVLISFEGPDLYSQAGGLGVRMAGLAKSLAEAGYETHLFFIGDPALPGEEKQLDGRLVLHRWGQWISKNCPAGVYEGEELKRSDMEKSLPSFVRDQLLLPALGAGRTPVVLLEEWQTVRTARLMADDLKKRGVREKVVMFWNANNPYGFDKIDWRRLAAAVTVTAVSKYMRQIIRASGVDAVVIPNGISEELVEPVRREDFRFVVEALGSVAREMRPGLFFKMARWEREKGWTQAIEAVRHSHDRERRMILIGRAGGPSGKGGALVTEAEGHDLRAIQVNSEWEFRGTLGDLIRDRYDVISLGFGVTPKLARTLYRVCDGVLANSVSEPFGLVGLEAMAAAGIAYTGGTGEDYAITGRNAIVLETLEPMEIVERWEQLSSSPKRLARLRRQARQTAKQYIWPNVREQLVASVAAQAKRQLTPKKSRKS